LRTAFAARGLVVACAALSTCVGCGSAKPRVFGQQAQIHVVGDGKKPIAGAQVFVNGELVMKTTPEGKANVKVHGTAGDKFQVAATCPEGFRPPTTDAQQDIYVTPGIVSGATPELVFRCESTVRRATIVVRAENGPNLPIRYLGREIGRTDPKGTGSVVLQAQQGDSFEIVVDTTGAKKLHPQNPALTFRIGDADESFTFDQKFTVEKEKVVVRAVKKGPAVPVRLN
jgi:hypothetical protein